MLQDTCGELSPVSVFAQGQSADELRALLNELQELRSGAAAIAAAHHAQQEFARGEGIQASSACNGQSLASHTSPRSIPNTPTKVDRTRLQNSNIGWSSTTGRHSLGRRAATSRMGVTPTMADCWSSRKGSYASLPLTRTYGESSLDGPVSRSERIRTLSKSPYAVQDFALSLFAPRKRDGFEHFSSSPESLGFSSQQNHLLDSSVQTADNAAVSPRVHKSRASSLGTGTG